MRSSFCIAVIGFTLVGFVSRCSACSLVGMPITRFDKTQYIITGVVTGYTMSDKPLTLRGRDSATEPTAGVALTTTGALYTPNAVSPTYEVYRFGLGADCSLYNIGVEYFKQRYPIGSKVQVFAGDAAHLPISSSVGVGRLEIRYSSHDTIYVIDPDDKTDRSSVNSPGFDYLRYRQDLVGDAGFELIKDLYRLESNASEEKRDSILDRLTFYPGRGLDDLFMQYTRFPDEYDRWEGILKKRQMSDDELKTFHAREAEKIRKPN